MLKECKICGETKLSQCFPIDKSGRDGKNTFCKKCMAVKKKIYRKTKKGVVAQIYSHQRYSSKKRGHRMPEYTKDELKAWLYSQTKFHMLYNEWLYSGYDKNLKPSVDRLYDGIHYCMNNIRLVTFHENMCSPRNHNESKP